MGANQNASEHKLIGLQPIKPKKNNLKPEHQFDMVLSSTFKFRGCSLISRRKNILLTFPNYSTGIGVVAQHTICF